MEVEETSSDTNSSMHFDSRPGSPLASSTPVPDTYLYRFDESDEDIVNVKMRQGLTAALREIYESEAELELAEQTDWRLTKQLYTACKKMYIKDQEKNLIGELVLRLNYIMEDQQRQDDRLRILISLTVVALRLHFEHMGNLLSFLIDYAAKNMETESNSARANSTRLMGLIFKYWVAEPVYFDDEEGTLSMSDELMAELYARMLAMMTDKAQTVRQSLIHAMADFQLMPIPNSCEDMIKRSPKEVIMAFFQDFNTTNQMAAIVKIDNSDNSATILNKLAHVAGGAPHSFVRKEALRRLGEAPIASFPTGLAQEILFSALNDPCEDIVLFAKTNVITPWISIMARECAQDHGYANGRKGDSEDEPNMAVGQALVMLLNVCDIVHHTQLCDQITMAALEMSRCLVHRGRKLSPFELAIYLTTDYGLSPRVCSRFNKDYLWEDSSNPFSIASALYLWRCMVQYGSETTADGCKDVIGHDHVLMRDEVIGRLAPALLEMVKVIEHLYKWKDFHVNTMRDSGMGEETAMYWNFAVSESMKICQLLEKEPFGLAKLKEIIQEIVLNTNVSKLVTDQICELALPYFPAENPEEFVYWFLNRIGYSGACAVHEDNQNQNPGTSSQPDYTKSVRILSFSMQLLHSVLSTGMVNTDTEFFRKMLTQIQTTCFENVTDAARPWMLKVATIILMSNEKLCRENIQWSMSLLKMERLEDRAAGLTCLYDVVKIFSSMKVDQWRKVDKENSFARLLSTLVCPPAETIEPNPFHYTACEVSCKYMLLSDLNNQEHRDNLEVIMGLLLSYFLPSCRVNRREKMMVKKFVMIYMQQSREHLARLLCASLACIKRMMGRYLQKSDLVEIHDIERVILATEQWFTATVLIDDPGEWTDQNCRFEPNFMMLYFYSSVWSDYTHYDNVMELMLLALARVEYYSIPKQIYHCTERYFEQIMKVTCQEYGTAHIYAKKVLMEWNKLRAVRIKRREAADSLGELQTTSKGTRGRKRRNVIASTRKPSASVQKFAPKPRQVTFEEGQEPPPDPAELRAQQFPRRGRNARKKLDF